MHLDKRNFLLNDEKDIGKVLLCNELKFVIKEDFGRNKYWIQLSEIEEESEKSVLEKSPLSYFFDDDMSVTDLNGNKYKIEKGDEVEIIIKGPNNTITERVRFNEQIVTPLCPRGDTFRTYNNSYKKFNQIEKNILKISDSEDLEEIKRIEVSKPNRE